MIPAQKTKVNSFDVTMMRNEFPILSQHVHGKPLVYLDNAASVQKPRAVLSAMQQFYEQDYANVHRGVHTLSVRATEKYEEARETVRRFINAPDINTLVFTRGATESINLVAAAYGRTHFQEGDEIILTQLEHHANIVPWQLLRDERKIKIKIAPINQLGQIDLEVFTHLLTPRVKLVAVTQMSNALGILTPLKEMIDRAHAAQIPVLVDGCQGIVHQGIDVQAMDVDFYAFSSHKIFGPTGIGVLYAKYNLLESMPPWQGGGDMIENVTFEKTTYKSAPHRFEAGTPSIVEAVGLAEALRFVENIGYDQIIQHEQSLLQAATERLLSIPDLIVHGTDKNKGSILSFTLKNIHPQDLGVLLDQQGIAVRVGHHCCMPLMQHLGLTGTCRASFALYNTLSEVDALYQGITKALRLLQ